jgi:stalled ribosome rescue protein Dom34
LVDIEALIYGRGKKDKSAAEKLDFLIVTEDFINSHNKHRIHRLIQIANNKGIITKTISIESPSADRFNQFGGILAFKKTS